MNIKRAKQKPVQPKYKVTISQKECDILRTVLGRMNKNDYLALGLTEKEAEQGYQLFDKFDEAAEGNI